MSPLPMLGVVDLSFTGAKLVAFWELTKFSGIIFCIYFVVDCISMGYNQHRVMGCSSQYLRTCVVWCAAPLGLWLGWMYVAG